MKVSLKQAFSILDGRLSTNMEDLHEMMSFIFDKPIHTHELPEKLELIRKINPSWFSINKKWLKDFPEYHDPKISFDDLMKAIDGPWIVELSKLKDDLLNFSDFYNYYKPYFHKDGKVVIDDEIIQIYIEWCARLHQIELLSEMAKKTKYSSEFITFNFENNTCTMNFKYDMKIPCVSKKEAKEILMVLVMEII